MLRSILSDATRARWARAMLAVGLGVAMLVALLEHQRIGALTALDHAALDALLVASASGEPATHAVVVDIDDASLAAVGQWPWPRYRIASLVQAISTRKPAAIGVDVLFTEPDRASLANVTRTFKRDFGVDLAFPDVPTGLLDNDGYLGEVLARVGAVNAQYFYFDRTSEPGRHALPALRVNGDVHRLSPYRATGVLVNTDAISMQAPRSGFINDQPDDDGFVRRVPLLIEHDRVVHPHLALGTTAAALGANAGTIAWDRDGPLLELGGHRIPLDRQGRAILRPNGRPDLYPAISAVDLLNGTVPADAIAGKVVFVGSSAAGLNDLHATAFDAQFPGLKVHAALAEGILTDTFVREPAWSGLAIDVACVLAGVLMAVLFIVAQGAIAPTVGALVVAAAIAGCSATAFVAANLFVSPAPAVLTAAVLLVLLPALRFAVERHRAHVAQQKLENARQVTIESMAAVAETRDPETGAHIKRTQHYVRAIAERLRATGHHPHLLTDEYIHLLFLSAPLHDIGKVGVPDHILLKPGRLDDQEYTIMKQHAALGRNIIASSARGIEGDNYLVLAGEIAATHHERWDGTGYPLGLAGEAIPLSGRIMAVADIYDALISRRCYKEPFTHEHSTTLMREARGKIFDPAVLDAFFEIEVTIQEIAAAYRDDDTAAPHPVEPDRVYDVAVPATATAPHGA